MCEIDSDFLIYLQFGPSISQASRLQIERYVKRVLQPPSKQGYDGLYSSSRKRRRRDDIYDDDCHENASTRYTSRRRSVSEDDNAAVPEPVGTQSVLVIYDQAAGFDLDTTNGSDVDNGPRYERGTNSVLGVSSDAAQALGNPCFNCAMLGHELRSCPMPLDRDAIEASRSAFKEKGLGQFNSRLYLVVEEEERAEEMRKRIRPGQPLSQELREALGLEREDDVPEYVQSIYYHGYPPAYIGSAPDQDPLLARDVSTTLVPATPMLVVYNGDDDYADEPSADVEAPDTNAVAYNNPDVLEADDQSSDEEGALSEGEVDSEPDMQSGKAEESRRNFPLVSYPGLDLAEFDFASTTCPGRPLRSDTPRRSRPRYDDEYRYHGEAQNDYYDGYGFTPQATQNTYADPFAGMLDGYYRSSQQTSHMNTHWQNSAAVQPRYDDYRYHQHSPRHDAHLYNGSKNEMPPPHHIPSSLTEARPDPAAENPLAAAVTEQPPIAEGENQENVNEDVEDGECDMEESD
ncbi:hypothetical protein IWW39_000358 [Coemansia spiralis]|uniref:CCHC-type domain-containing protein n=1 Tax=Coemansia spiralis TaxID=417178 RepID=A0A9W8L7L2_9FUNG|nr:hypothetical protein IWW39_000358 [Coemansia spiralis]